jgi:hypothetical protein
VKTPARPVRALARPGASILDSATVEAARMPTAMAISMRVVAFRVFCIVFRVSVSPPKTPLMVSRMPGPLSSPLMAPMMFFMNFRMPNTSAVNRPVLIVRRISEKLMSPKADVNPCEIKPETAPILSPIIMKKSQTGLRTLPRAVHATFTRSPALARDPTAEIAEAIAGAAFDRSRPLNRSPMNPASFWKSLMGTSRMPCSPSKKFARAPPLVRALSSATRKSPIDAVVLRNPRSHLRPSRRDGRTT